MECYKCRKLTPVTYPEIELKYGGIDMVSLWVWDALEILVKKVEGANLKYPYITYLYSKTLEGYTYANICKHCGAHQGGWFVFEAFIENIYDPNYLQVDEYKVELNEEDIKKHSIDVIEPIKPVNKQLKKPKDDKNIIKEVLLEDDDEELFKPISRNIKKPKINKEKTKDQIKITDFL